LALCPYLHQCIASVKSCAACSEGVFVFLFLMMRSWKQRRNETQTESCILFVLVGAMVVSLCLVLHQWIVSVKSCAACSEGVPVFSVVDGGLCMPEKRNRSKKKRSCMGVPFAGGVVSWLVSFSCVPMSLSVPSEQRRPDRSCGEVS